MGFYDREYYREQESRQQYNSLRPKSMVMTIIVINLIIFLANEFVSPSVNEHLLVRADTIFQPWQWWRLLTYGFAHGSFAHIFGNMLALFFLGPPVERKYGQKEFLLFYLTTIVVAGLAWCLWDMRLVSEILQTNPDRMPKMLGASGGICGVVILMALNYPRMSVYLYGLFEMPMWVLGVMYVILDTMGAFGLQKNNIAYVAHLAGAGFALGYFLSGMNFSVFLSWFGGGRRRHRKLGFSVSREEDWTDSPEEYPEEKNKQTEELDRILQKISEHGKESLTWRERRLLTKASHDYQRKHQQK